MALLQYCFTLLATFYIGEFQLLAEAIWRFPVHQMDIFQIFKAHFPIVQPEMWLVS